MKTKILFTLLFFACRIHYLYGQTNLQIAPETLATPEKNGIWLQKHNPFGDLQMVSE